MIESLAQIVMGLAFGVILGILGAFPLAMYATCCRRTRQGTTQEEENMIDLKVGK